MHLKNEIVHPEKYMHTFYTSEKKCYMQNNYDLNQKKKIENTLLAKNKERNKMTCNFVI